MKEIEELPPSCGFFRNTHIKIYPLDQWPYILLAKVYPDGTKIGANISRREFLCNLISSCRMYPHGKSNNGDGAIINLGGVISGATISDINSSVVRTVSMAEAKS
jgi:hypothetical protein